jgi:hypothetical protein
MTHLANVLALTCALALPALAPAYGDETAAQQTTGTVTATSAKEACDKLAEAGKNGDFNTVQQLTMSMPHMKEHMKKSGTAKKDFEKMRKDHMDQLKELKCSSEQVVEDHAFVTAEAKEGKRLIPFVKEGESWKFDARTYMSFYKMGHMMKGHGMHKPDKG